MDAFHPELLWALPLGLIPIIIYYLMRFRSLKVTWGAEYVLRRALERLKKHARLDQLLLLVVRVLACLLFVLTFARLVSPDREAVLSSSGIHRVVLVDTSASMAAAGSQGSRWERGMDMLTRLSAQWGRGERFSILAAEMPPRWLVRDGTMERPDDAMRALADIRPGDRRSSLAHALGEIARAAAGARTEIYILADEQALSWEGVADVAADAGAKPTVYWLCPPLDTFHNLAVTRVDAGSDRVLSGHAVRVEVTVRHFGTEAADVPVSLLLNGLPVAQMRLSLLGGQTVTGAAEVVFPAPGSHRLTARLGEDVLALDNEMTAAVEAVDTLSLAVLRRPAATGKFRSAGPMLEIFARTRDMKDGEGRQLFSGGGIVCVERDPGQPETWRDADLVLVDGGSGVDAALAEHLRAFRARGGGLLFAADARVDGAAWNSLLGELLPARLGTAHALPLEGDRFRSVDVATLTGGPLSAFRAGGAGDLSRSKLYAWTELSEPLPGAVVLARLDNQQPFLVATRGRPGMTVLVAAGLNSADNNLLVREFSAAFLHRLVLQTAESLFPRNVGRGAPLSLSISDTAQAVLFSRAGEEPHPLAPRRAGALTVAEVPEGVDALGACSFLVVEGESRRHWFSVQGEWRDSDLTPLSAGESETLAAAWGMRRAATWAELDDLLRQEARATEWHPWCIALLFLLLAGEMLLQRRFA